MVTTLCNEATAEFHAGTNHDTAITTAQWTEYINQAEGQVCMESKTNWIDSYSGLNDDYKKCLELATALLAANLGIKFNMPNYKSLNEAQTMFDMNNYLYEKIMLKLKESQYSQFVTDGL